MKAATPLFLLVIVACCRTNCHPVHEDEFLNNGNWLDDEFLDDAVSTSLLNPFDIGRFTPRLSPFLQPPTIDFEEIIVGSFPGDDILLSESEKYSKKPLPNVFVLQPPSTVMEPPTREFGANPKKPAAGDLFVPRFPSLESLRPSFPGQEPSPESFWSPFSQDLPTSVSSIDTEQQVPSASVSSEVAIEETKEPKTALEVTEQESKSDSETTQEREATSPILEIDEPSRLLVPPTREFQVEIPRSLVPPTEEFSAAGSN